MTPADPRIVVLTAPSGAGKTSIALRVLRALPQLRFSVSATTRAPRQGEVDGRHYHFLSEEDFNRRLQTGDLLEYEEVYPGRWYGTLKSEVNTATTTAPVLLDIDVRGAKNVKDTFGQDALVIFIAPPSIDELEERLKLRGTESAESLETRLNRARIEMSRADSFDQIIVNDDLETATEETLEHIKLFFTTRASR